MNRKITRLAAVLLTVLMLCSFCGCETFNNFKAAFIDPPAEETEEAPKVFKIGIMEPLTGTDAAEAADEILGIEIAYELHETEIDGVDIELVYADNKSDVNEAPAAAQSLIDEGVRFIIGSYKSIYTLAASDVILHAGIPSITATNTNPLITQANSYYFRACYVDSLQGAAAADFSINKLGAEKVAVLVKEGYDIGTALASEFEEAFEEVKGEGSVQIFTLPETVDDYGAYFDDFTEFEADAVYFPSQSVTARPVIESAVSLGREFSWIGTSEWADLQMDGVYYTMDYDPETGNSGEAGKFKKAYSLRYGNDAVAPDNCALGYDAYLMCLTALETAGPNADTQEYIDALVSIKDMEGATGTITMSGSGDPIKTIAVAQYSEGTVHTVFKSNPHSDERSE